MKTCRYLLAACWLGAATGCTHVPLCKNSIHQAEAVCNMQTQQVLDNLAMFVCEPSALPYFSYPNQSGSQVTDQANVNASLGWARITNTAPFPLLFSTIGLGGTGQRSQQEAFTITPVNDPRKLELMRCAYQTAVRSCGRGAVSGSCPDCVTRFKVFYTGDPNGDIAQGANGIVTSECLKSDCCWFHVGCKKCAPKDECCALVGQYCGCYVWVKPDGRDELTKLTLCILDYAMHDPPVKRTKTVVFYLDEYGLPTTQSRAVGNVNAQVAIDEQPASLLNTGQLDIARIETFLDYRHQHVKQRLAVPTLTAEERKALIDEDQMLQSKLDYLHEQLRVGGLREQYYPRPPAAGAPSVLQFQMQQNTIGNFGGAPPSVPTPGQ